jgi:hypothetical protein
MFNLFLKRRFAETNPPENFGDIERRPRHAGCRKRTRGPIQKRQRGGTTSLPIRLHKLMPRAGLPPAVDSKLSFGFRRNKARSHRVAPPRCGCHGAGLNRTYTYVLAYLAARRLISPAWVGSTPRYFECETISEGGLKNGGKRRETKDIRRRHKKHKADACQRKLDASTGRGEET